MEALAGFLIFHGQEKKKKTKGESIINGERERKNESLSIRDLICLGFFFFSFGNFFYQKYLRVISPAKYIIN